MRFKRDRSISLNWSWWTDDVSSHINFGKQAVLIVAIIFARRKATVGAEIKLLLSIKSLRMLYHSKSWQND